MASLVTGAAVAFFQVPLLLRYWSGQEYGLWVSLLAALSLLTVLDTGHQNFVGNEIARLWARGAPAVRPLLSSGLRAAFFIALSELALGALLMLTGTFPSLLGVGSGPTGSFGVAPAFLLYLVFWTTLGSAGGLLARLYAPAGRYAFGEWLGILNRGTGFFALALACMAGANLFGAMAAQVLVWTALAGYFFYDIKRNLPDLYPWWKGADFRTGLVNFRASLLLTGTSLLDQLAGNGLLLVVTGFFSPVQAGLLATLRTLANLAQQGSSIFLNPIAADLARFHGTGEGGKIRAVLSVGWATGLSLTAAGLILAAPLLGNLYGFWTHHKFPFDAGLFAWLGTAVVLRNWAAPLQLYLASTNSLKSQLVVSLMRGGACLGVSLALVHAWGIHGVGAGIFLGEAAGAVASWIATQNKISQAGGKTSRLAALCGLLQVMAVGAALGWPYREHLTLWSVSGVALLWVASLGLFQWRRLEPDLQKRILRTLTS